MAGVEEFGGHTGPVGTLFREDQRRRRGLRMNAGCVPYADQIAARLANPAACVRMTRWMKAVSID
jgi:hypothetical protein